MSQQATAQQQVLAIREQLLQAFIKKTDAEAAIKEQDLLITALRNVLAGIPVGQQLVTEAQPPAPPST